MFLQKFKLSLLIVALAALMCAAPLHHVVAAPTAEEAVQDVEAAYDPTPTPSKTLFHPKKKKKGSKDFVAAHSKPLKKSAVKKTGPAVQADDLMNAMRQDINPETPVLVPAPATTTAPVAPAAATTPAQQAQQALKPIPSEKLFHPNAKIEAIDPKNSMGEALPPVTEKTPPVAAAPVATPPVVQEYKKEEPTTTATADTAKKEEVKTGAPLLSDLSEAPSGAEDVKADDSKPAAAPAPASASASSSYTSPIEAVAEPAKDVPKEAAAPEAAPAGLAKPRPLFSSASDKKKRPGIVRAHKTEAFAATADAPSAKAEALPPVTASPNAPSSASEPMIKPVADATPTDPSKKSIWEAPNPEMTKGKVVFSQSADGTVTKPPAEPASTSGEVISTEEAPSKAHDAAAPPEVEIKSEPAPSPEPSPEPNAEPKLDVKPEIKSEAPAPASAEAMNEAHDPNVAPEAPAVVEPPSPKAPQTSTVSSTGSSARASEHRVTTSSYNPTAGGIVHGSCGAVNGVGLASKPADNLCTQGTPSSVRGKGPWNWTCNGANGGSTVNCSATVQINGECGPANGSLSASPPPNKLCASGKATTITGNGPWYWSCFGDNGGVTAQCVVYTLVSGACGPANGMATAVAPTTSLCKSGHETAVIGEGPWSWSCTGSGENTTVSCTAPLLKEGACGEANGVGASSTPRTALCSSGNAGVVSGVGPWNWNCTGENGGASVSCSAPILLNAACGPAHGIGVATAPSQGLCITGSASAVAGAGPWSWTCNGENGGAMVDCMAPKKLDGTCGPAHQAGSADAPAAGLCNTGTPSAVSGTGPWQWSCQGAGGGITTTCISQPLVHAACGAAHGASVSAPPIDNLCSSGIATTVIGSGPFMWSCQGVNGGSAVNCMAPLQVNGACGGADGVPVNVPPMGNLCRTGIASTVSGTGPYVWTCSGASGGISTTCQAPLIAPTVEPVAPAPVPATAPEVQVPQATTKAGNECTPSVKRWTITCQQGGYPSNYTGVIVGETQTLCPTNVERGVWLSNSCAPATDSAPVSPSPGKLETPVINHKVTDTLPEIAPMPAKQLDAPKKLYTPHYKQGAAPMAAATTTEEMTTIAFAPTSEGLDATAVNTLDSTMNDLNGDEKSIITLNAYAATPADGNQQESRRMALARALAVRSYLMRKGLASNRIDVRAVGPASDNRGDDRVDIKVK